ncbi:hypothetical protein LAZ67_21001278 [Cordylochernes scorpioides]|uniref:Uncharacterized protein n=1 Tax=Cordylochernes scorpioides TaxID=51811 RepID=A0ABY6LLV2_9ARAC|nr:hypothetical protein LAZ67_21001278 [Cordylochernes scorpioides]
MCGAVAGCDPNQKYEDSNNETALHAAAKSGQQIVVHLLLQLSLKHGRASLEDDPHEGWPKTAITMKAIEKVHNIVLDDKRVKVWEIAEAVGILEERLWNTLD